ncbi:putative E3 ubiquitin-protein ligase RING1a isoform X1 [Senna tora]|uniref:Putative E3 ubiquitin-protein ligase RING1a isoform X1 n=1 Tax=Senna tora TaxID=362788 RepID=A0A834SH26_9FABA|nr:putative E3 ubiquitin-protein ligase RING1a isoform X1 [Senna tora]
MPAQTKRLLEAPQEDAPHHHEQPEDELESDRSPSWSTGDKEEWVMGGPEFWEWLVEFSVESTEEGWFVVIKLSDVRKEVQCPICLGIIRKTRTVMECLHRFCRECIDKSMRLGNNECPSCRTHCASRRSLRDDPNYDALIAALYPDIDKYEEEDMALHEDEKALNKQIQASFAQTLQRQTEAVGKKRNAKATAAALVRRSRGNHRTSHVRLRRNCRSAIELQGSDDNEDMNDDDGVKGSSSGDELVEIKSKRCKRGGEAQLPLHSATNVADGASDENVSEVTREFISPSGTLAWGKNGHRSHTRVNGKNARNSRLSKLVDNLHSMEENDDKLGICLMLVSLDEQKLPSLQRPYLCCKPTLSVRQLCQYVAHQTALQADEVEICLISEQHANIIRATGTVNPCINKWQVLREQQTLAELTTDKFSCGHLEDMPFFFLKNPLGSKMKKGIRNFCSTDGSTSTLNQHHHHYNNSNNDENTRQISPTLEDLILQLELEEEIARKSKLSNHYNNGIMRGRMSCVNNSDILRSARNALNQYPRFSLDGRDAMYRSSFGIPEARNSVSCSRSLGRRLLLEEEEEEEEAEEKQSYYGLEAKFGKTVSLPSTFAGESVVWCEPGVVGKLMGLEAMPVPVSSRRSERKKEKMMSGIVRRQNYLRRRFERHHHELEKRLAMEMQGSGIRRNKSECCSRTRNEYCIMKPVLP